MKRMKKIPPQKEFLTFQEMELFCSNIKEFLAFQGTKTLKNSLQFPKESFSYMFQEIFQEIKLSCISGKTSKTPKTKTFIHLIGTKISESILE